jgi:hypothetical protein
MSEAKTVAAKPPAANTEGVAAPLPAPQDTGAQIQELKVTGHLMQLPAGLFCFVNEANPAAHRQGGMPGVRVSPPPMGDKNIEISSFRPDGWLNADGDAALVRVRKGPAQVLVTIYQLPHTKDAAPRLQVRQLLTGDEVPAPPAPAPAPTAPAHVDVMAHIQTRGDVPGPFGAWLGERGSNNWIEGLAIMAPEGMAPDNLSYQGVLGRGWLSPWVPAGEYCGSRGMALPLLGMRVKLSGEAAQMYDITVGASFVGGATAGPVGNDEICEGDTLAPLEAFIVTLTPRAGKPGKIRK